jgi:hypothetical protein
MALPTPGVTPANWGAQLNAEILASATPLAYVSYGPGSAAAIDTTSSTMADCDATNLAITFTVPASGRVLVTLDGWVAASGSATMYNWGLRESTTTVGDLSVIYSQVDGQRRMRVPFLVTGLTPDASLTYKWAHRLSLGSTSSGISIITAQPAIMMVSIA